MRMRTMVTAFVLAATAVLAGSGAAIADDNGFQLVKVSGFPARGRLRCARQPRPPRRRPPVLAGMMLFPSRCTELM